MGPDAGRAGARRGAGSAEELVDHVDADDRVVGTVTRREMRAGRVLHRCVFVVVSDGAGRVLVHRRADWKDVWPSRWDLAFGGVVAAGEAWDDAAARELAEEAGVVAALTPLGSGRFSDETVQELARAYRVVSTGPFSFVDGEVSEVAWVALADLDGWIAAHDVVPDSVAVVGPLLREGA